MKQYIYCDTCRKETLHEVVREDRNLYRCTICGTHLTYSPEKEIEIRAIVSTGARSIKGKLRIWESELIERGDEYIVDTPEGHKIGEVTSLEMKNGTRSEAGEAKKVATVWMRDVGEVVVRFSLHKRSVTSPFKMTVDGETEFEIGEVLNIDGKKFRIHRIKLLEGGVLKRPGSKARARDIRRIYAKYEGR